MVEFFLELSYAYGLELPYFLEDLFLRLEVDGMVLIKNKNNLYIYGIQIITNILLILSKGGMSLTKDYFWYS